MRCSRVFAFGLGLFFFFCIYIHNISWIYTKCTRNLDYMANWNAPNIFNSNKIVYILRLCMLNTYNIRIKCYTNQTAVPFTLQNLLSHYIGTHAYSNYMVRDTKNDCLACRWTFHCKIHIYLVCIIFQLYWFRVG